MDLDDLYRLLRSAHIQAQGVLDTLRDPLLVLDSDLTVISANPAFYRMFETDRDETIGAPLHVLGDGQWNIGELRTLLEQVIPRSASVFDYEVTGTFPVVGHRTMLLSAQRIEQSGTRRHLLLLTIVDATERKKRGDVQDVLIEELQHRMKNLISITRALARQTSVDGRTASEYRDAFLGRFDAVSKIHALQIDGDLAELPQLIRYVLAPYMKREGAVVLEKGAFVSLTLSQAAGLALILHELATNALKYGALSVPDGRVTIVWNVDDETNGGSIVNLRWRENHGPSVTPPTENGFGSRLIRFTAEQNLGGQVELDYDPKGLIVTIAFPRSKDD
jgi:two-component sensor histidine kinase